MSNDPTAMAELLAEKTDAIIADKPKNKAKSKRKTTTKLKQDSQEQGKWHESVLLLVINLVKGGKSDDEVHAETDKLTTSDFTVEQTRDEVQKILDWARNKDLDLDAVGYAEYQIEQISKLSRIQYEIEREQQAKDLGMRVKTLDSLVAQYQSNEDQEESNEVVEITQPYKDPTDAVGMANYLQKEILKHTSLSHNDYAAAVTLWCLSTWFIDAWRIMPHLFIRSLTKRSGKTTLLELVEAWTYRSYTCANITAASLFRAIEEYTPTLLLDEVDLYLANNEELNGIMNAGHTRRTAKVTRLEKQADGSYSLRNFNVFGGKCMAGIGKQLDTMMDRSIIIKMVRRLPEQQIQKLSFDYFERQQVVRQKIARFAEDKIEAARTIAPDYPNLGNDRAQDNWLPLFVIAELIGGDWPEQCLKAYQTIEAISASDAKEQEPIAVRIVRELADKIEARTGQWIRASDLRELLISDENSEFFEFYNGNPISAKSIKKHLSDADIGFERNRNGSHFDLIDIKNLIARYAE